MHSTRPLHAVIVLALGLFLVAPAAAGSGQKTITFTDLMKFRAIEKPVISDDGSIVAYGLQPDRGDGEGIVEIVSRGRRISVPRGGSPVVARDGRWVAMVQKPPFAATETAPKDKPPRAGMALVEVSRGSVTTVENVERFVFSDDGRWLAYIVAAPERAGGEEGKGGGERARAGNGGAERQRKVAGTLKVRELDSGNERTIESVASFAIAPSSRLLAYVVSAPGGKGNGLFLHGLLTGSSSAPSLPIVAAQKDGSGYANLAWSKEGSHLAFSSIPDEDEPSAPSTIWLWQSGRLEAAIAVANGQAPAGWMLPFKNALAWSEDGSDLFFGFKPMDATAAAAAADRSAAHAAALGGVSRGDGAAGLPQRSVQAVRPEAAANVDPYDVAGLLAKAEVDVWHWGDARIIPNQKRQWESEKDRTYAAVLHLEAAGHDRNPEGPLPRVVALADREVPEVGVPDNARVALGTSDVPYAREASWGERFRDVYSVDLLTGKRRLLVSHLRDRAALAPDGRSIVFHQDGHWRLAETASGTTRAISSAIPFPLVDEQHDTPGTPASYGFGGWVDDGAAVLVYDRFDIWMIPTAGSGTPVNVTGGEGRKRLVTFRVVTLDPERKSFSSRDPLLLTAYHNREKNWGFYAASVSKPGVELRVDEKKVFRFVAKAKKDDALLYTREDYGEFPDLWVSDVRFREPRRVSDANPQLAAFAWGSAELVDYVSRTGIPLQGVLIKPANYQPGRRYPVITYFYERQSQRLYEFNEPVVNHRPSFPVLAGAGYAVFLPDIVFTVGAPGKSIMDCLVPGVEKLVEMGIADRNALGLHGHSWGGYGTAYVVTQTDMFKAAVAGAPVANMTSAYGGIRWESGLSRQFQYERAQSRIGGTLWDKRELYIENSPLFFADRVRTPLLIEHGDEDGAVPWYQGIELYLALRRLDKESIFLQYRGEPHHLRKYPNKLDYSIKMLEYFDHHLKGTPAPAWMRDGVPYRGK